MAKRNTRLKKAGIVQEYTPEQIEELVKCMEDPIYFAKTYVKIKHPIRGKIPFGLYPYQEEMMRMFMGNRYNILLSARQTGKTETSCAFLLWFAIFQSDKTVLIVSNKATNAKEIISKIQYAYEELPDWLKPGINENSWNKHECMFDNNSRIVAQTTAPDSGRGLAISLLFCDEFAFVRSHIQEEFWLSVSPTLATGGACIIASTPNGDNNLYATLYKGAELGANDFKYAHVPWDAPPGRDEAFKQTQIGLIGERKWKQEYECDFLSSDGNLIDGIVLAQITKLITQKKLENRHIAFTLLEQEFFKPIERGGTYLVMVDPATGSGEDFSVIQVFDFPRLEQVMEFRDNTSNTPVLYTRMKNILNFLSAYGCTVHFTIENNGIGNGLISLYEVDEFPPSANLISEDGKGKLGFTTNAKNKLKACIKLKEMVEKGNITINSPILAKELSNYVRREGSYAAQRGSTDDCVSTLLLMTRIIEAMVTFDMAAYSLMYSFEHKNDWAETVTGKQDHVEGIDYFHMTPIESDYYK